MHGGMDGRHALGACMAERACKSGGMCGCGCMARGDVREECKQAVRILLECCLVLDIIFLCLLSNLMVAVKQT